MIIESFIEQFGEKFSHDFTISPEVYSSFQSQTKDMNPLHVDEEYAKGRGFQNRVMYGNILNGFISYFVGMCLPCPEVMLLKQDIIYLQALYLNDTVTFTATIENTYPKFNMVDFKYNFMRQDTLVARGHIQIKLL